MGRFMVPDWAAKPTTVPYANFGDPQSLNLYAYVGNRPVTRFDVNGHCDPDNHCSDDPIPLPGGGEIRPTPCYCDGPGGNDPSAPVPGQNGPLKPDAQITLRYPPADSTPGIEALFHAPGMSSYWNNAAGAGNFFGYATMGVLGGVPALGTALPAAASAVGYGLGYAQGVVAVGTSGAVLIGKYGSQTEGYLADAEELGVGAFNLGDKVYGALNYFGAGWNANMGFLDAVTSRGAPILLGTQPVAQTGGYAMELDYLFQSGYGALIPAW
jgi:hypothetical protein